MLIYYQDVRGLLSPTAPKEGDMRKSEMNEDYNPQHDKMLKVPESEQKHGFWTRPHTPRELKILIGCFIGLAATVVLYVWATYPHF